jgi:hypothetical protein
MRRTFVLSIRFKHISAMQQVKKYSLFWCLLFWLFLPAFVLQAQGWWSGSFQASGLVPGANVGEPYRSDGNYIAGLSNFVGDTFNAVANAYGEFRLEKFQVSSGWRGSNGILQTDPSIHVARGIVRHAPAQVAILEEDVLISNNTRTLYLSAISILPPPPPSGVAELWRKQIYASADGPVFAQTLLHDANGHFWVLGMVQNDILLLKIAPNGTVIWSRRYANSADEKPMDMILAPNGDVFILKSLAPGQAWLLRADTNGNIRSEVRLDAGGTDLPYDLALCADGNLLTTGRDTGDSTRFYLQKTDNTGNVLWRRDHTTPKQHIFPYAVLENAAGNIAIGGTLDNVETGEKDGYLMLFDAAGLPLWERKVGRTGRPDNITKMVLSPDGGYVMAGRYRAQGVNHAYTVKTDANGIIKPSLISGNIFRDLDANCLKTPGDSAIAQWTVRATQTPNKVFYGTSDMLGNYTIECDTGNYQVDVLLPNNYWSACQNAVPVRVGYLDSVKVDFGVKVDIFCPIMQVEHASLPVRPCDTTYISIDYCNTGTATAVGASLKVTLDSLLTYVNATIPATVTGQTLLFDVGNLAPAACGHIDVAVGVACTAAPGQTVCSEVQAFPDTICLPQNQQWKGAFIQVKAKSDGQNVHFDLKNTGKEPSSNLEYIIIEDAVLLRTGNFQLSPGQEMRITESCDGSTLRLWAAQQPNAPGNSIPTVAVEGCLGNAPVPSLGFVNQFPQNDADPGISVFCLPVTNSFDDKQAFPTGFGAEHNIFPNTDIEYMIRFQNTGTDTAFRVVLLDTLSTHLDLATLRPGASSHPYTFKLEENGVARFTFRNIQLPHAAVDEPGSNGFVTFRIAQKANNPVGTRIENRAGIYFDYNLPIITNTTLHTVHKPWLRLVSTQNVDNIHPIRIIVSPNPFTETATFVFDGEPLDDATLSLYDLNGRIVKQMPFAGNQATLERADWPGGMYFFVLENKGKLIGSGRLVAE